MKRLITKKGFVLAAAIAGMTLINLQAQDLKSALLLTKSEQYDKAGEMLNKLIQNEPGNSKNYFFLGENAILEYFADTISNSLSCFAVVSSSFYQKF